jgi:hypothetical protein
MAGNGLIAEMFFSKSCYRQIPRSKLASEALQNKNQIPLASYRSGK